MDSNPSRGDRFLQENANVIKAILLAEPKRPEQTIQKKSVKPTRRGKEKAEQHPVVLLLQDPVRFITPKKGAPIPVYRGFDRRLLKKLQSNYRREQLWKKWAEERANAAAA